MQKSQCSVWTIGILCLFGISCLFALCFWLSFGNHRNDALVATGLAEVDGSVDQSEERVVLTDAHVVTRVVLGSALANDDVAGEALLATPNLYAKSLSC